MVKNNDNDNDNNEKYGGTGYEISQVFCSSSGFMTSNKHGTARFRLLVRR